MGGGSRRSGSRSPDGCRTKPIQSEGGGGGRLTEERLAVRRCWGRKRGRGEREVRGWGGGEVEGCQSYSSRVQQRTSTASTAGCKTKGTKTRRRPRPPPAEALIDFLNEVHSGRRIDRVLKQRPRVSLSQVTPRRRARAPPTGGCPLLGRRKSAAWAGRRRLDADSLTPFLSSGRRHALVFSHRFLRCVVGKRRRRRFAICV